jgi:hypothetical protein
MPQKGTQGDPPMTVPGWPAAGRLDRPARMTRRLPGPGALPPRVGPRIRRRVPMLCSRLETFELGYVWTCI